MAERPGGFIHTREAWRPDWMKPEKKKAAPKKAAAKKKK